jgi:hypothetical protein
MFAFTELIEGAYTYEVLRVFVCTADIDASVINTGATKTTLDPLRVLIELANRKGVVIFDELSVDVAEL